MQKLHNTLIQTLNAFEIKDYYRNKKFIRKVLLYKKKKFIF